MFLWTFTNDDGAVDAIVVRILATLFMRANCMWLSDCVSDLPSLRTEVEMRKIGE